MNKRERTREREEEIEVEEEPGRGKAKERERTLVDWRLEVGGGEEGFVEEATQRTERWARARYKEGERSDLRGCWEISWRERAAGKEKGGKIN